MCGVLMTVSIGPRSAIPLPGMRDYGSHLLSTVTGSGSWEAGPIIPIRTGLTSGTQKMAKTGKSLNQTSAGKNVMNCLHLSSGIRYGLQVV